MSEFETILFGNIRKRARFLGNYHRDPSNAITLAKAICKEMERLHDRLKYVCKRLSELERVEHFCKKLNDLEKVNGGSRHED